MNTINITEIVTRNIAQAKKRVEDLKLATYWVETRRKASKESTKHLCICPIIFKIGSYNISEYVYICENVSTNHVNTSSRLIYQGSYISLGIHRKKLKGEYLLKKYNERLDYYKNKKKQGMSIS